MGKAENQFRLLYHRWERRAQSDEIAVVHPDGCRDLIVFSRPGQCGEIRFTSWDFRPRTVELRAGTEMTGYRLRPGITLDPRVFESIILDFRQLEFWIECEVSGDHDVIEIIQALTQPQATIESVSRQQGVATRTLQRRFRNLSLPTPDYWRLLGRARRAIHALPCRAPLADIACEYGYSDQAHMTREFVRWFGLTPTQLRHSKVRTHDICQPGLGNWTDEGHLELGSLH